MGHILNHIQFYIFILLIEYIRYLYTDLIVDRWIIYIICYNSHVYVTLNHGFPTVEKKGH